MRNRNGVTLVELLIVIAVLSAVIALLLPAVQSARETARRIACSNNLKQLALGCHGYEVIYGALPPDGYWRYNLYLIRGGRLLPREGHSAFVHLLPQLGHQALFDQVDFDLPSVFSEGRNAFLANTRVQVVECASDDTAPRGQSGIYYGPSYRTRPPRGLRQYPSSYGWNNGWRPQVSQPHRRGFAEHMAAMNGAVYMHSNVRFADIRDGTSSTFLIGERAQRFSDRWGWFKRWNEAKYLYNGLTTFLPLNESKRRYHDDTIHSATFLNHLSASSSHPGGASFAFCDGSVKFIPETIESWEVIEQSNPPLGIVSIRPAELRSSWLSPVLQFSTPDPFVGVYQALSTRNRGETNTSY